MTSVELLERAAKVLRDHAAAATPGPWEADGWEIYGNGFTDDGRRFWVGETLHDPDHDGARGEAEGAYIALMHPPVALALADWLEAEAATIGIPEPSVAVQWAAAAVARAILREEP